MKVDGIARQGLGRLLRIALTGSVCLAQVLSKASEPATIVLVANHADATIIPLLHAELSNLGLNVLVVDRGDHELSPSELTKPRAEIMPLQRFESWWHRAGWKCGWQTESRARFCCEKC